jgi:predicted  nucleic acid-binding Zn-ribbon protein
MMDAKEPLVIEYLRQEARDGSEFLYDVYGGVVCATSMVLDGFATLTRERDVLRERLDNHNEAWVALNDAYATLTRERDAAVKRRREIDDEAFDYAEQIETLKTQLAAARELMAEAAVDIKYMVNAEYHGPDDVHPAMRAKYTRDMEIVSRLTAALSEATP